MGRGQDTRRGDRYWGYHKDLERDTRGPHDFSLLKRIAKQSCWCGLQAEREAGRRHLDLVSLRSIKTSAGGFLR